MKIDELLEICRINETYLKDMVEYEVITITAPLKKAEFDVNQLNRIKTAIRLQRDLEVNLASLPLILDLLDELHELRIRAKILEKHLLK